MPYVAATVERAEEGLFSSHQARDIVPSQPNMIAFHGGIISRHTSNNRGGGDNRKRDKVKRIGRNGSGERVGGDRQ